MSGNPEQAKKPADATSNSPEVDYEKRFKDTQSAYTKSQQALRAAEAKVNALEKLTTPSVELDASTKAELDTLKYEDPDAWHSKLQALEKEAQAKHSESLASALTEAEKSAELERRSTVLAEFTANNPDVALNDEVLKYDIPPRITAKLESGEVSFEDFLTTAAEYLRAPKVTGAKREDMQQVDLGKLGGGDKPSKDSTDQSIEKKYANTAF